MAVVWTICCNYIAKVKMALHAGAKYHVQSLPVDGFVWLNGNVTLIHLLSRSRSTHIRTYTTHIHRHPSCTYDLLVWSRIAVSQDIKYDLSFWILFYTISLSMRVYTFYSLLRIYEMLLSVLVYLCLYPFLNLLRLESHGSSKAEWNHKMPRMYVCNTIDVVELAPKMKKKTNESTLMNHNNDNNETDYVLNAIGILSAHENEIDYRPDKLLIFEASELSI